MDWHNLEVFFLQQSERDEYFARVPNDWMPYKATRVLEVSAPVMYAYLTGLGVEGTVHERWLIRRIADVKFYELSQKAFFRVV